MKVNDEDISLTRFKREWHILDLKSKSHFALAIFDHAFSSFLGLLKLKTRNRPRRSTELNSHAVVGVGDIL